jgi:WD40 repeat protein
MSPDGRLVAGGGKDGAVWLWHLEEGRPAAIQRNHTAGVHGVAFSPYGRTLVSGSLDGTVRLWDADANGLSPRKTLFVDRRYKRMDITGRAGITEAQRAAFLALGAVEHAATP